MQEAKSTVALLGTLRELHEALPRYDLGKLASVIAEKRPDLLCVEVDRPTWESGDLEKAPVETRAALADLARSSDITLVPIGSGGSGWSESGVAPPSRGVSAPLRRQAFGVVDRLTAGLMRAAGSPRLVNSALVEHLCGGLCDLQASLADRDARAAWEARNRRLLEGILWILRRDPGRRVLVALDCRRKHWLRRELSRLHDVSLVDYWRL